MKKNLTIWFAVLFVTMLVCFTPGYCDDAPETPGDSGVTDAVTPRFVKPGKISEKKNVFAEPAEAEGSQKAPEPAVVENTKKAEEPKKESFIDKLKNMFKPNRTQDPKTVESAKK
jgi:hypothetical protein